MTPSIVLSDLANDFVSCSRGDFESVYGALGYWVYGGLFDLFGQSLTVYYAANITFIVLTALLLLRINWLCVPVFFALCVFPSVNLNLLRPYSLSGLVQSFLLACLVSIDKGPNGEAVITLDCQSKIGGSIPPWSVWLKRLIIFLICLGKVEIALAVVIFTRAWWGLLVILPMLTKVVIALQPMSLTYPLKLFLVSAGGFLAPVLALIQEGPDLNHALQMLLLVLMIYPFNPLGLLLHARMFFNQGSQSIYTMHMAPMMIKNQWQRVSIAALCGIILLSNLHSNKDFIFVRTPYGQMRLSDDAYGRDMLATADFIKANPGDIWAGPNMDIYFLTGRAPVAEKGYIPFLNHHKADGGQSDRDTIEAIKKVRYVVIDKFKHSDEGWLPRVNRFARSLPVAFENRHFLIGEIKI